MSSFQTDQVLHLMPSWFQHHLFSFEAAIKTKQPQLSACTCINTVEKKINGRNYKFLLQSSMMTMAEGGAGGRSSSEGIGAGGIFESDGVDGSGSEGDSSSGKKGQWKKW